jgi:hypothetical protein
LFYFYEPYFPQTLQSPCTSLSNLVFCTFISSLCSYPDQKKKAALSHLISTELFLFTCTSHVTKFQTIFFGLQLKSCTIEWLHRLF